MFAITIDSKTYALEYAFIESSAFLENSKNVSNFYDHSDREKVEIDVFERSNETLNKFGESLLIPHGLDSVDSLFHSICFAVSFLKSVKSYWCEIEEALCSDVHSQLCDEKDFLQLDLDYQKFQKQCFRINKILSKHGYFLRVFEKKKKIL